MGNQNAACCGAPITDKAALMQGTTNSKFKKLSKYCRDENQEERKKP